MFTLEECPISRFQVDFRWHISIKPPATEIPKRGSKRPSVVHTTLHRSAPILHKPPTPSCQHILQILMTLRPGTKLNDSCCICCNRRASVPSQPPKNTSVTCKFHVSMHGNFGNTQSKHKNMKQVLE